MNQQDSRKARQAAKHARANHVPQHAKGVLDGIISQEDKVDLMFVGVVFIPLYIGFIGTGFGWW